jgi:isopenicillin-N epimerase
VDGAQSCGVLDLHLREMGCDIYTGSCHKWLGGPRETGLLYVRREVLPQVAPRLVSADWDEEKEAGAQRLTSFGQRNDAALAALIPAVHWHQLFGTKLIEERVRYLTAALKSMLQQRYSSLTFRTPLDPAMSAGIVTFHLPGIDLSRAESRLYASHRIACDSWGDELPSLRFCPHLYTTLDDLHYAVEALASLA